MGAAGAAGRGPAPRPCGGPRRASSYEHAIHGHHGTSWSMRAEHRRKVTSRTRRKRAVVTIDTAFYRLPGPKQNPRRLHTYAARHPTGTCSLWHSRRCAWRCGAGGRRTLASLPSCRRILAAAPAAARRHTAMHTTYRFSREEGKRATLHERGTTAEGTPTHEWSGHALTLH
eukprot:6036792-Prymnesium_polylepis.1